MKELKEFYGKEMLYIHTTFTKGKIAHSTVKVKVYDPYDLNKRIRPADGCDIVIGDYSTNSKYIFSLNGIKHSSSILSLENFGLISIFTYCWLNESETVMNLHVQEVMKILNEYVEVYSKKVANVTEWIKSIE